jgi:TrpR-related protein YerC/YecD
MLRDCHPGRPAQSEEASMLRDRTHLHHPAPSQVLDWDPDRGVRRRSGGEGETGRPRIAARGGSSTAEDLQQLATAFLALKTTDEVAAFLRDLCTPAEIEALSHRLQVARLLAQGLPYATVAERVGASTTTVTRVAQWLRRGEGGYGIVLERTASLPAQRTG